MCGWGNQRKSSVWIVGLEFDNEASMLVLRVNFSIVGLLLRNSIVNTSQVGRKWMFTISVSLNINSATSACTNRVSKININMTILVYVSSKYDTYTNQFESQQSQVLTLASWMKFSLEIEEDVIFCSTLFCCCSVAITGNKKLVSLLCWQTLYVLNLYFLHYSYSDL